MSVAEYFDNLAQYGRTAKGADASSMEALEARWKVMAAGIPEGQWHPDEPNHVLDVGCGYGGFADHLAEHRPDLLYTGLDVSLKQVELARQAGHHAEHIDVREFAGQWDVVLGQGLFYKQETYRACYDILAKMWDLATHTVVIITILNGQIDELHPDIPFLLEWVEKIGCTKWTLRHDYHPNDVCLYLYKERHGTQRRLGGVYHV